MTPRQTRAPFMTAVDILAVLWHQKWVLLATVAGSIALAIGAMKLLTPEYEATSTVALSPKTQNLNSLVFFQTIDSIVPIYAEAVRTEETKAAARAILGGPLADVSVKTYTGAPIIKIVARGTEQGLVQETAQVVTEALVHRVRNERVGVPSLRVQQIDRPEYPSSPVFPRRALTIAVATLLGLGLGIAAAFLRESLANRIRTRADLAEATGVPVYAEIPHEAALARPVSAGVLLSYPGLHGVTEALRDLRTNLLFPSGRVSSVAVTGPEGRHGKTTVSVGLAVTMARAGARTLLVDADLRRGRLANFLELEPDKPGLREVLEGGSLEAAIRGTALAALDVLPAGELHSDPGELLSSRFAELLRHLEQHYDTVVVDTTPLVPVGDARTVASATAATVLVASAGAASQASIRQALERLALIDVTPTGVVLNKSRSRQARSYYGAAAGNNTAKDRSVADALRD